MLTAAASPLVSGARPDKTMTAKTIRIKVLRPFLLRLERQDVGKEIEVDRPLGMELASANKAEILRPDPTAAAADPKPAAPAKVVVRKEA
jgi:hypothetical protein